MTESVALAPRGDSAEERIQSLETDPLGRGGPSLTESVKTEQCEGGNLRSTLRYLETNSGKAEPELYTGDSITSDPQT